MKRGKKVLPAEVKRAIVEDRRNGDLIKVIAGRYGVALSTVWKFAAGAGVKHVPKWQKIVDYARQHPTYSSERIAKHFKITTANVVTILSAHGLSRGVIALGREAQRAGLTVEDIRRFQHLREIMRQQEARA